MTCCGDPLVNSTTFVPPPLPLGDGCLVMKYHCECVGLVDTWKPDAGYGTLLAPAPQCVANCAGQLSCTPWNCVIELPGQCVAGVPQFVPIPWCLPSCCVNPPPPPPPTTTTTTAPPTTTTTTTTTPPTTTTTTTTTTAPPTTTTTTTTTAPPTTTTTTTAPPTTTTTTTAPPTTTTTTTAPPTTTTTTTTPPCGCDPDSSYAGKTMTVTMIRASRTNGIYYNQTTSTFTGIYIGGGAFLGTYSFTDESGQYANGGSPDCPLPPTISSTSSGSYETQATIYCESGEYHLILNGEVIVGCSAFPCFDDSTTSYNQTCTTTYESSCYSISGYALKCQNHYSGAGCLPVNRDDVAFDEVLLLVSIA